MAGGRPKKTVKDLSKNWKSTVTRLYKAGASDMEIKAALSMSNDLFSRFMDEEKEFSESVKKGKIISQAWWEKQGRTNLTNREFSPVLWFMNMRNRFRWTNETPKEPIGQYDLNEVADAIRAADLFEEMQETTPLYAIPTNGKIKRLKNE